MRERRICILTQPLSNGYGGLLQAYALQTVLKRMGHKVWTEDRKKNSSRRERIVFFLKSLIIYAFAPILNRLSKIYYSTPRDIHKINKNPEYFKFKYLSTTVPIYSNNKNKLKKYAFDTYIVGSDQVWRPKYSYGEDSLYNYFLDFTINKKVTRIAYAASFGVSKWEFSEEQTIKCASLIKQFDHISVREDNGVDFCKRYFNVDAELTLDPTLLLDKEEYIALVEAENEHRFSEDLFCYFLDPTNEKEYIAKQISERLNIHLFSIMPTGVFYKVGPKNFDKCIYAPVTSWLRAYMDAKFIVTDSFHGTVFSIIFNKPFIVIANEDRGISRFTSILKLFGLEDRLIYSKSELTPELITRPIDFDKVNSIKKMKQRESLSFLTTALKDSI